MNIWEQILSSIDIESVISILITAVIIPLLKKSYDLYKTYTNTKCAEIIAKTENETVATCLERLKEAIDKAVIATNQTMVDQLKNMNSFTEDKWVEAYEKTKNAALASLSESTIEILKDGLGNFEVFVDTYIQASVKANKLVKNTIVETATLEAVTAPTVVINTASAEVVEKKE